MWVWIQLQHKFPAQKIKIEMIKSQFKNLHRNAITEICQASSQQEELIVQAYNIAIGKNDKLSCLISDGRFCIRAFFKEKNVIAPGTHDFAIIMVKNHVVGDGGRMIGIVDFDIVYEYSQIIGNPVPIDLQVVNPEDTRVYELEVQKIKTKNINMIQDKSKPLTESVNRNGVKQENTMKKEMRMPEAKALSGNVKDYETIKGLFIGLKGWHLLCRITKLDYSEHKKKDSDKIVRVLNIELMDRSEVRIAGAFFYEVADKFKDYLKLNSVYKISQGSISNENYNNSKNEKFSPFKLMFNVNSVFEQVSDVNIIAKTQDSAITLNELLMRQIFNQEFDIIGILVEIQEPKQITKGDKQLKLCNWVIADPIQKKRINAVLWNDKIKTDTNLIGRTILLSRFDLKNYNGTLTLNSKMRSLIQPTYSHPYRQYEYEVMKNYSSYEMLSDMKVKQQDTGASTSMKNTRELNMAIENLDFGQSIRSDLDIFVIRLFMKKWYYDGCPHCNKSAEKTTSCSSCNKYVEETVPHFIMNVELADAFGSVYSTAYDDQSKKIFWEEEGVIFKLLKLDQKQLKDVVEDYFFQQFKLRMYTKREKDGKIKHNMGRLQAIAPEKCAIQNLSKIRELMGNMMN